MGASLSGGGDREAKKGRGRERTKKGRRLSPSSPRLLSPNPQLLLIPYLVTEGRVLVCGEEEERKKTELRLRGEISTMASTPGDCRLPPPFSKGGSKRSKAGRNNEIVADAASVSPNRSREHQPFSCAKWPSAGARRCSPFPPRIYRRPFLRMRDHNFYLQLEMGVLLPPFILLPRSTTPFHRPTDRLPPFFLETCPSSSLLLWSIFPLHLHSPSAAWLAANLHGPFVLS